MKKNKPVKELYSVTIFSQTDVRKRPIAFRISRSRLTAAAAGIGLAVLLAIGTAAASFISVSSYSEQFDDLCRQVDERTSELASLSVGAALMQEVSPTDAPEVLSVPDMPVETQPPPTPRLMPQYSVQISKSLVELQESGVMDTRSAASADLIAGISIDEAMAQIDEGYDAQIEMRIESIKEGTKFDAFNTVYDGDIEGDSDRVNNWADVMAVYAVITDTELRGLSVIPEADMDLLRDIYNSMNELAVSSKTTAQKPAANSGEAEDTPPVTTLTACLSANSLTYSEGAALHGFDKEQKQALEELMSPDYYTVFAQLLGIDYYDGMSAEELTHILSNLQEGTIGETIVQAALTRLGNPYSKGKRGSGRYVDCSYFAWWVYDQAGVIIPTSSVEQARYCYKNGCAVEMEKLQPGDLIFWSKTSCDCGRWHEVHHTAIYLGDNKVIEASSRRGRVVINDLWSGGEWRVFMYARPYV
jgi:cell wall-associated NlpC family hydrolase